MAHKVKFRYSVIRRCTDVDKLGAKGKVRKLMRNRVTRRERRAHSLGKGCDSAIPMLDGVYHIDEDCSPAAVDVLLPPTSPLSWIVTFFPPFLDVPLPDAEPPISTPKTKSVPAITVLISLVGTVDHGQSGITECKGILTVLVPCSTVGSGVRGNIVGRPTFLTPRA